mgnify:CR=1 FL=1
MSDNAPQLRPRRAVGLFLVVGTLTPFWLSVSKADPGVTSPAVDLGFSDRPSYISPDGMFMLTTQAGWPSSYIASRTYNSTTGQWDSAVDYGIGIGSSYGCLSPDGNSPYMTYDPQNMVGQNYRSRRVNSSWATPELVPGANISGANHWPSFNGSQLYWTYYYSDIYVADYDAATDQFLNARLVSELSAPGFETDEPWISADGCLLIFTSNRPGGYGGLDLWFTTFDASIGKWGNITNFGPYVNTAANDREGAIAEQAGRLFFHRIDEYGTPHAMEANLAPSRCGWCVPDTDSDGDGTPDCHDGCPNDPNKSAPGDCGCGVADTIGFVGFLPPIGGANATGGSFANPLRAFRLGSTIPVKFMASQCGNPLLTGVHTLAAVKYSNAVDSDPPIDATPTDAATSGNQFRLTDGQWHFNLSTRTGFSTGTWKLVATLSDGGTRDVWITIKK